MSEAPPNHPTSEELRALSLGQLTEAELARVSAHLGDCPACCSRMDQLAGDDPLLARLQRSAARRTAALVTPDQRRSAVRALRQGQEARSAARRDPGTASVILPCPRQVGDYDVLGEVGRGGMGVVYRARHRRLHRLVALKMMLAGEFASPAQQLRFRLEAELAARLQHPNVVQVYEIGSHEGRPFLALEWVEGGSLASRLDGAPWPPGEAAWLIETLARAIHAAHSEGVVHRDLKPANVMLSVGQAFQPDSSGREDVRLESLTYVPKITDFGLAQPTEGGMTLTQSGFLVGTPSYVAPEQASGKRALVGPATDVYALGVMLYQLLTGRLPHNGDNTLEVLRAVTADEPVRPRRLRPRLPRDLEAITLHCLEKEPARRYPTALALAEDLERFRQGKQVVARPVGAAARLARACRRRPVVALLLGLLTVTLFGGLAGVSWKWLEADEQRDRANAHARKADDEKHEALYQAYRARLAAASAALQNHDVADAARQLEAAPRDLRGWEWRHFHSRLDDSSEVIPLRAGGAGFLIAEPDRLRVAASTGAGLRLTDLAGGVPRTLPLGRERGARVFPTRRGLRVAAVASASIELLDEGGQAICRMEVPETKEGCAHVAVSPDATRLACEFRDGKWWRVALFDATTGKRTAVCDGHEDGVWALAFSLDGTRLASGGEDKAARLWDPATGALRATCRGHGSKVMSVSFSPDGDRLVTTSSDATVRQWEVATGDEVEPPYDRHSGQIFTARYSPDGQRVASAGSDRAVRVWQARGRQDVAILHGHVGRVTDLAFAPGGRRLASLCRQTSVVNADDTVRVWDVDPQAPLPVLWGHERSVNPVAFSPDGRWLASGSWDTNVLLWDAATGESFPPLRHPGRVRTLAYGPDGRWLVSGCDADEQLRIWDTATGRVKEIPGPTGVLWSLAVSPDGTRVATTAWASQSDKYTRHVCDLASGERLSSAEGRSLGYSPDGRWLAVTAADSKTVLLLDARTHETAAHFRGHEKDVCKAAFSPDGRRLATCSKDCTVRLWPIDGGPCQVLRGHTDEVFAVAFHPDGSRLASGGMDQAVWLWDLGRGEEVARLQGHTSFVWSLAFSPDGKTLASGSGDRTVRLWDTAPLRTRYQARREGDALRPEAARLVGRLFDELREPDLVVSRLREDGALSAPLRRAASSEVLRRGGR